MRDRTEPYYTDGRYDPVYRTEDDVYTDDIADHSDRGGTLANKIVFSAYTHGERHPHMRPIMIRKFAR